MSESLNDKLESFFRARPNKWVNATTLMTVAGSMGWRTRVSNIRKRGMVIQNHVESILRDGKTFKTSYYRYVPEPKLPTHVEPSGQVAFL